MNIKKPKLVYTDILLLFQLFLIVMTAFSGDFEESPEEVIFISEPVAVTKSSKVYIIEEDNILVHNKYNESVQCFDFDGNFLWGMLLPSSRNIDSTKVSFQNGQLIVHDGENSTAYFFDDFRLIETNSNLHIGKRDFYKMYPFEKSEKYNCRLSFKTDVVKAIKTVML